MYFHLIFSFVKIGGKYTILSAIKSILLYSTTAQTVQFFSINFCLLSFIGREFQLRANGLTHLNTDVHGVLCIVGGS